jgi:hypothetical protein
MSKLEMDQSVVRKLLEGRQSIIPSIAEKDEALRNSISEEECPVCSQKLRPRIPSDPTKVFSGTTIRYEKVCAEHGVIGR